MKKIAIVSTQPDLHFYTDMLNRCHMDYTMIRSVPELDPLCDALLLPGGGDPDPTLFHSRNLGSRNINLTEDLLQLIALERYTLAQLPILGICKGMQMINLFYGGTLLQDLPLPSIHQKNLPQTSSAEKKSTQTLHICYQKEGSFLDALYGHMILTNSDHHQSLGLIGSELAVIARASDRVPEAIIHKSAPIIGLQWHPERMLPQNAKTDHEPALADGGLLFQFFLALI